MLNLPLHSTKKVILSFEFGVVLSNVAKEMNVELTPEIMARAEKIIEAEFKKRTASHLAGHMQAIILAIFETN